jgi:fructose transport system permease protein
MKSLLDKLPPMGTLGPFIALLLACMFFATQNERFMSLQNFSLIMQQVMVVGTIAIGQTLVILTAGIDLSCGMIMALGSIIMTKTAADYGLSAPVAIALGIGATALFGLVNGLLVTKAKLPPFIVTLGTLNITFAITQLYSGSQTVTAGIRGHDLAEQLLSHWTNQYPVWRGADAGAVPLDLACFCGKPRRVAIFTPLATAPKRPA